MQAIRMLYILEIETLIFQAEWGFHNSGDYSLCKKICWDNYLTISIAITGIVVCDVELRKL